MATFSTAQITDLAEIVGSNSDVLGLHLSFYAGVITDDDKVRVLERVTEYRAIESDNVHIEGGPASFKGRISPSEKRSLIKKRIADLIQFPIGDGRLVRG